MGFAVGLIAGALLALGLYLFGRWDRPGSGLILVSVLFIPGVASALAVLVSGIRRNNVGGAAAMSLAVVTALLGGAALIFHEGAICLVMAAPLFYAIGLLGGIIAASVLKPGVDKTSISVFTVVPLLLLATEPQDIYPTMDAAVISSIDIDAPLEVVWRDAVEIRDIRDSEQSWTITHNLLRVPRPLDARLERRGEAVVRRATWRGDVHFFEIVTDWRAHRDVTWRFDIPEAAQNKLLDEHLRLDKGYLSLEGGRYDFSALSPTRTRLTLTTSYAVRTPLNAYVKGWGALLLGDIHRHVLSIVRERAEADAGRAK